MQKAFNCRLDGKVTFPLFSHNAFKTSSSPTPTQNVSTVLNGRTALTTTTTTSTATKREQSGFLFFRLVYDDIAMSQFVTQARILSSRPRKKSFFHIPITFCHLQSISLISAWHVCVKTTRAWKNVIGLIIGVYLLWYLSWKLSWFQRKSFWCI